MKTNDNNKIHPQASGRMQYAPTGKFKQFLTSSYIFENEKDIDHYLFCSLYHECY